MGDLRGFTRDLMRQMEPGQSGARQKMTLAVNAKRWCPGNREIFDEKQGGN
jgi:hypothetical protein